LPEYKPFAKNAMDKSNYGLTVELDFKIDSVLDYDKNIINCVSTDRDGTIYAGFRITGRQA
jgi:tRNA splicing ligase